MHLMLVDNIKFKVTPAGSLLVFKGKYRVVLINYPEQEVKEKLFSHSSPQEI